MRKNLILLAFLLISVSFGLQAQTTVEELKAQKTVKLEQLNALQAEVNNLDKRINEFPGWKYGGVGVVGFDLNSNNDWFAINTPNSTATGWGLAASAFANQDQEKYFWRNLLTLNLKRVNTVLNNSLPEDTPGNEVRSTTDALDLSSLFGYKLNEKWAISAEGKYVSTLLNFNRPGKLTLSAGATWTPINNLVVIIHPLAYEFNFPSGDFVSSPGAKIGATYAANIIKGVSWSSNLSAFIPYTDGSGTLQRFPETANSTIVAPEFDTNADPVTSLGVDYSTGDLFNWTWINSFSTNIWNGIGVGFNIGLRQDVQIANQSQYQLQVSDFVPSADNPVQMYYTLGLSYTL